MDTGKLTPRSNEKVNSCLYAGQFGQPDGFASVLEVTVNRAGECALSLTYKSPDISGENNERLWSVMLTSDQRKHLAEFLTLYEPTLWDEDSEND